MSANGTLRLLREQLNLSMQEVADAVGVSFRTALHAEQGHHSIRIRDGGSARFMAKPLRSSA